MKVALGVIIAIITSIVIVYVISELNDPSDDYRNVDEISLIDYSIENRTIYFSVNPVPIYFFESDAMESLDRAVNEWNTKNQNVNFYEVHPEEYYHIEIEWQKYPVDGHYAGVATLGYDEGDKVTISLGDDDCNGNWVPADTNSRARTIAHELGHVLGLDHHTIPDHLMYSESATDAQAVFDNQGLVMPNIPIGYYGDFIELEEQSNQYKIQLTLMESELDALEQNYLKLEAEYEKFPKVVDSSEEYQRAMNAYDEYLDALDQFNNKVDEYNQIVSLDQVLVDKLNCFPNILDE